MSSARISRFVNEKLWSPVMRSGRYLWQWTHFIGPTFFWEWAIIVPPVVILAGIFTFKGTEPAYRICGGILQILGVGSVFWGVYQTRKSFGQDGGWSSFIQRLSKWPRWQPPTIGMAMGAAIAAATGSGRAVLLKGFPEGASADERLDLLLSWVNESIQDVDRVRAEVDQARNELRKDIESERSIRAGEDARVMKTFEGISTGGLSLTVAATVWIIAGLVFTTFSTELAGIYVNLGAVI